MLVLEITQDDQSSKLSDKMHFRNAICFTSIIFSRDRVTMDRVRIGNRIIWTHKERNHK
jgi:hypothetical protein